jgi:hypothetical protein
MNLVFAGMILFVLPLLVTATTAFMFQPDWRVYPAMVAFFLSSIVAVSIAAEQYHGRIRDFHGLVVSVGSGFRAFGWWALAMGGTAFAVLGLYSVN